VCRDHDECLGSFLDWINPLKYAHCQMQMCADLAKCDCSKSAYSPSECKTAKYYMMLWACVGGALPIPGL
jgi:hypothetical protein